MRWKTKKLGDESIVKISSGGTPSRANPIYYKGNISWLKSGELNDSLSIKVSSEKISEEAIKRSSAKIFPTNTVLLAMYGATAGKLGILSVPSTTNQAVAGLIPNNKVLDYKYLFYFLLFKRQEIIDKAWGGAQPNISLSIIKTFEIPLPPIEIQQKNVNKIEELFEKIDEAQKIREESQKSSSEIFSLALNNLFEATGNKYEQKELGKVTEMVRGPFGGSLKKEIFVQRGVAVYEQGNVINNDLKNFRYFIDDKKFLEMKRFLVKENDILMSCSGTIGKLAIVSDKFSEGIINQALLKISPNKLLITKYLFYVLKNYIHQNMAKHVKGSAIKNVVAVALLKKIIIPIPPIGEQNKIVEYLDSLSEKVKDLQKLQGETAEEFSQLRASILHEAFEGNL